MCEPPAPSAYLGLRFSSQLLLSPETSDWLVELMAVLGGAAGSSAAPNAGGSPGLRALVANARQLLVAFCSLSGKVLPRRPKQVLLQHGAEAIAAAAAAQGEEGGRGRAGGEGCLRSPLRPS